MSGLCRDGAGKGCCRSGPTPFAVNQDGDLKKGHDLAVFWAVFSLVALGQSAGFNTFRALHSRDLKAARGIVALT